MSLHIRTLFSLDAFRSSSSILNILGCVFRAFAISRARIFSPYSLSVWHRVGSPAPCTSTSHSKLKHPFLYLKLLLLLFSPSPHRMLSSVRHALIVSIRPSSRLYLGSYPISLLAFDMSPNECLTSPALGASYTGFSGLLLSINFIII